MFRRWAAKEAAFKAFGTMRIPFPDIVVRSETGRPPALTFEGSTADVMAASGIGRPFVSLSHDGDYAIAQVVLQCTPGNPSDTPHKEEGKNPGVVSEVVSLVEQAAFRRKK